MSLFRKKVPVCDMCGKTVDEGCGESWKHVEAITGDDPPWLPANLRAQGDGDYTWLCTRCDSYPSLKWPSESGADSAMSLHLGKVHRVGQFAGMPAPTTFEMIER